MSPHSLSEKLVQLGLTHNQAAVYEALLQHGQSKAAVLIKETGLHRNIVYEALDALEKRLLIFKTTQGGVALFQLSDPDSLLTEANQRLSLAQAIVTEVNISRSRSNHEVKLYEGMSGLQAHRQSLLSDLEESKEEHYIIAGSHKQKELYDLVFQGYDQQRIQKQLPAKILFSNTDMAYAEVVGGLEYTAAKILPQHMQAPVMIDIWKDHVAFMTNDEEPFVVSIRNAQMFESFREYFQTLWQQDVETITGLSVIQTSFLRWMYEMKPGEEYMVIGANYGEEESANIMRPWFVKYHKKRLQYGVRARLLTLSGSIQAVVDEIVEANDPEMKLTELRVMQKELTSPMQINIYPTAVRFIYWDVEEKAVAIDIRRKDIRDAMVQYFTALWNASDKV